MYLQTRTDHSVSDIVKAMTDRLAHRGPDDEGYFLLTDQGPVHALGKASAPGVKARGGFEDIERATHHQASLALGHRRLSVIDLSVAGHQPMTYGDDLAITYNGEIYNYLELRKQLQELGYQFKTQTDTEVLLAAYQHWGDQFTNHLKGMWALVIYDRKRNQLFGSRDRFGVKPLYYVYDEKNFAFASEQKALLTVPFLNTRLSRGAAFDYLVNGNLEREAKGLFVDVMELMPGCNLAFNLGTRNLKIWHYFTLVYKPNLGTFDEDKMKTYSRKIRKMLLANLKQRLQADVPVSILLSGGIDSSAIACLADHISGEAPDTFNQDKNLFSVVFPGTRYDESKYARLVVDKVEGNWHKITPDSQGLHTDFQDLVYTNDIPFTGLAAYSQYALFRKVNEAGVKVALDGQGADEMFSGYADHFRLFMSELLENNEYAAFMANFTTANNSFASRGDLIRFFMKRAYINMAGGKKGSKVITQKSKIEYRYLRTEFWEGHRRKIDLELPGSLNGILHKHYTGTVLKTLLRCGDRNSMRFGVEVRTPFADDHELAQYVFNIQSIYKVRYGQSKILLRSALGDTLPLRILNRRDKMGFATPQRQWIRQLKGDWLDYFDNRTRDLIDVKQVHKDWKSLVNGGTQGDASRLWRLINFAAWRHVFNV